MKDVVTAFLVALLAVLVDGLMLMLGAGYVHAQWIPALPTIGYWHACVVAFFVAAVLTPKGHSSD